VKILRLPPPAPPPPGYGLEFSRDEGWVIVAALADYAATHPDAAERDEWRRWAKELDRELRL